jgi:hypothetical protein
VPFEKAIDLIEDLETQHMLQLGLAQMSASPARQLASASEIRFVGLRNRMEVLIEVILPAALGANHLRHRRLVLAPCLFKCERPVERVGIFHRYDRGQRPAVLADREPLDDVEFLCVRRTEGIDVVILAACEPVSLSKIFDGICRIL